MADYNELIKQSQENVNALSTKLKELDELYQKIKILIEQPKKSASDFEEKFQKALADFQQKFQAVTELAKTYTDTLDIATKTYLDGSNLLFVAKLKELGEKLNSLQKEIDRLVNTDFEALFKQLQQNFDSQIKETTVKILTDFGSKLTDFQVKIDDLKEQVIRLTAIDLEEHFNKHQQKLSEIFNAINAVNTILTGISQTLISIVQDIGSLQSSIESKHREISKRLDNQDRDINSLNEQLSKVLNQNTLLNQEIKINRLILISGFAALVIGLVALFLIK
jgi:DNA repair exonuclease SbcCD ATPase subunit